MKVRITASAVIETDESLDDLQASTGERAVELLLDANDVGDAEVKVEEVAAE